MKADIKQIKGSYNEAGILTEVITNQEKNRLNQATLNRIISIHRSMRIGHLRWVFVLIVSLDVSIFLLGFALIIFSVYITFKKDFSVDIKDWISGIIGIVLEGIGFLLYYPIDRIERSSANHSQHKMITQSMLLSYHFILKNMDSDDKTSIENALKEINESTQTYVGLISKEVKIDPEALLKKYRDEIKELIEALKPEDSEPP